MVATIVATPVHVGQAKPARRPPLQNGDRLTRAEFERRYAALPNLHKAELIEGVVQMPSPVHVEHMEADLAILGWLSIYVAMTPCVRGGGDGSVRLDADNEVQPDALLRIDERCGGQSRVTGDGFIEGAPELVVEISASTVSYDLHAKLNIYRRAGVQEYVVWRIYDGAIDWFVLDEGRYIAQTPDAQGSYHSRLFPGLILPAPALLAGDLAQVLATVQQGVQTPEHSAFVQRLRDLAAGVAGE
jgi:Uma2 family endonuclease